MTGQKDSLIGQLVALIAQMQDATLAVDEAAAAYLEVNLTDLHCLNLIAQRGSVTPGELAAAADRTPAAITVAVDRLERAGLAQRTADAADRRRTLVTLTDQATQHISALWGPIQEEGAALLSRFTIDQLQSFSHFLTAGIGLQDRHAERIRRLPTTRNPVTDEGP